MTAKSSISVLDQHLAAFNQRDVAALLDGFTEDAE